MIAGGISQVLLDPEIALCGLNRSMSERNLDLLKRSMAFVGELGKGTPEIVRRYGEPDVLTVLPHDGKDRLGGHAVPHNAVAFVDGPEEPAGAGDARVKDRADPAVQRNLGPGRHGNRAHAFALARKVKQYPPAVPLLDMAWCKQRQLFAPEAAANQKAKQNTVALALVGRKVGQ